MAAWEKEAVAQDWAAMETAVVTEWGSSPSAMRGTTTKPMKNKNAMEGRGTFASIVDGDDTHAEECALKQTLTQTCMSCVRKSGHRIVVGAGKWALPRTMVHHHHGGREAFE